MDTETSNQYRDSRRVPPSETRFFYGNGRLSSGMDVELILRNNEFSQGNPLGTIKNLLSAKDLPAKYRDDVMSIFNFIVDEYEDLARLTSPTAPPRTLYSMFCFKYEIRNR